MLIYSYYYWFYELSNTAEVLLKKIDRLDSWMYCPAKRRFFRVSRTKRNKKIAETAETQNPEETRYNRTYKNIELYPKLTEKKLAKQISKIANGLTP